MDALQEKLNPERPPLIARCGACGAETHYDPVAQRYHCLYCGSNTPLEALAAQAADWQNRQRKLIRERLWDSGAAMYRCPGCGATTLSAEPREAPCAFCGSAVERCALSREIDAAPLFLPFALTTGEAAARLRGWAEKSRRHKEARRVVKQAAALRPCYLPCRLIRGPVQFEVSRECCCRRYICRDNVQDALVNCSAQVDSLMLNAVEPFDWSPARAFDPVLLGEAELKLRDLPEPLEQRRVDTELANRRLGAVEQSLGCGELLLQPDASLALCFDVLVPVYLLTVDNTRVLINGQNGRIAVTRDKPKPSRVRLLEPLCLSLLAALFWIYVVPGDLERLLLGTLASAILIFCLLSGRWGQQLHRRLFRLRDPRTELWEARLFLSEPLPESEDSGAPPLFFEPLDGEQVPVEIRHFSVRRALALILFVLLVLLLPCLLVWGVMLLRMLSGEALALRDAETAYGAAWYVISAAVLLIGWLSIGRCLLFDHPILRRLRDQGGASPIPAEKTAVGRQPLWARLHAFFGLDALVGVCIGLLLVLLGSVLAMLSHL